MYRIHMCMYRIHTHTIICTSQRTRKENTAFENNWESVLFKPITKNKIVSYIPVFALPCSRLRTNYL